MTITTELKSQHAPRTGQPLGNPGLPQSGMTQSGSDPLSGLFNHEGEATSAARGSSSRAWWVAGGIVAVFVVGAVAAVAQFDLLGGKEGPKWLTDKVVKGDLTVTVSGKGTLESASNENIKCRVAGGSKIVEIVDNGKYVKKGDHLVTLDTSSLEDQIRTQTIAVNKARAAKDQAEKEYEVAQIGVTEYEQGTFLKELDTLEANVIIAQENLSSAKNSLDHSQRMFRKGYISSLQLEAQQFAVRRSELELKSAEMAKTVLNKFTKEKMLTELKSKVETAQSKMDSEKNAFALEESRLKRLQDQLGNCVIKAPKDGTVIYANESSRFGQQSLQIEQGATVAEGKDILRLPDMSKMQAKLTINETKVGPLRVDLPVTIRIKGDRYQGRITSIANQHEQKGWMAADVKEYPVFVLIEDLVSKADTAEFSLTDDENKSVDARQYDKDNDGIIQRRELPNDAKLQESFTQVDVNRDGQLDPRDQLKPGMTADAVITVEEIKDVYKIPVTAVVSKGTEHFCWVRVGRSAEKRAVKLGKTDDSHYQVEDGVSEGDEVVLNPRSQFPEARQIEQEAKNEEAARQATGAGAHTPEKGAPPAKSGPPAKFAKSSAGGAPSSGASPGGAKNFSGGARPGGGIDWQSLDKDGDGKWSKDEVPEFMKSFFDRVDANQDGFLDASELEAMRKKRGG